MASSQSRRSSTARFPRTARVNEVLREVVATALERHEEDDPRLELVTVTAVKTEPDLRHATVFFSALDTQASLEDVKEALQEKRKSLQSAIAHNVRLKRTPQLMFELDSGITEGQRVEELLRRISPISRSEDKQESEDKQDE